MILMVSIFLSGLFVVLKVIGLFQFSWWWVFSPWFFCTTGLILYGGVKEFIRIKQGKSKK